MKIRQFFRNLPIQRKLLAMTLMLCATVLLVVMLALFGFQILTFRSDFKRDTAALASIVANNSTAALAFDDTKAATEIIGSLRAKPTVRSACLANARGELIAHFGDENAINLALFPPPGQFRFIDGLLLYTANVEQDGKRIGALYLRTEYQSVLSRLLGFYGLLMLFILAGSSMLALWLSDRLGRVVTAPLLSLAETAKTVGKRNDYSMRSTVANRRDELGLLAESFNHMLARIQSQDAALNLSQQKFETLVNSLDGVVWEWSPKTLAFTFVSPQSERILGYPPEIWLVSPKFWDEVVHPDDREKATAAYLEAMVKQQPYHCEYRMIAADKRVVWIRESAVVLSENGQASVFRGIFQDITEQKRAAEELERLNRRLMESSRFAGMAEVATGVLHNVGNVLNSVNVSATLLHEQLEKSRIATLRQATGLLREHLTELPNYIASDPKGKLLPGFLIKVSDAMFTEHSRWQEELKGLKKNIEHMKEIVAMQQSYARVSGVIETLDPHDLLEDALQVNAAGLLRHGVNVIRMYEKVSSVSVDKHKVMQVLINLIRNAKYALEAAPAGEKKLTLSIGINESNRVVISIQDNGIGIPKENLTRIFSHGFTTKRDGHGFGLHSGALAAKELGGSLIAESEGLGKGAKFTLELPAFTPAQQAEARQAESSQSADVAQFQSKSAVADN
jgi:PAS domain S-box-containing protein